MNALDDETRFAFSRLLKEAREKRGWNGELLAEKADEALSEAISNGHPVSAAELEVWRSLEISSQAVYAFERFPAYPLQTVARRGRLLGIVLALGLDPAEVRWI